MAKANKQKVSLKYHWKNFTYGTAKTVRGGIGFLVFITMAGGGIVANHKYVHHKIDANIAEAKTAPAPSFDVDLGSADAEIQNKILNIKLDDLIKHKTEMMKKLQEAPTKMDVRDLEPYIAEVRQTYDQKVEDVLSDILTDKDISELDFKKMHTRIIEHNLIAESRTEAGNVYTIDLKGTDALSLRECQGRGAYTTEKCMHVLSHPGSPEQERHISNSIKDDNVILLVGGLALLLLTYIGGFSLAGSRVSQGRPYKENFFKPQGN